jgi:hypothetical protein
LTNVHKVYKVRHTYRRKQKNSHVFTGRDDRRCVHGRQWSS